MCLFGSSILFIFGFLVMINCKVLFGKLMVCIIFIVCIVIMLVCLVGFVIMVLLVINVVIIWLRKIVSGKF